MAPVRKESNMLIPRSTRLARRGRQGCLPTNLAGLRSQLADPSNLNDGNRQRLLELSKKLARVRGLGDEYARVGLSECAQEALNTQSAAAPA